MQGCRHLIEWITIFVSFRCTWSCLIFMDRLWLIRLCCGKCCRARVFYPRRVSTRPFLWVLFPKIRVKLRREVSPSWSLGTMTLFWRMKCFISGIFEYLPSSGLGSPTWHCMGFSLRRRKGWEMRSWWAWARQSC